MINFEKQDPRFIPEINIGMLGHVDHGKTTLVEALTGKWTDTHSEEMERGITIRLGYADVTFYKCKKCGSYSAMNKCIKCMSEAEPTRTVSFVDAPGHESLMATVLTASSLMDGAVLVISATEKCPLPQTREHLTALELVGINKIVVVQNKIDLVSKERVIESYNEIKSFLKGTIAEKAPIIPISAQQKINIEYVIEAIEENIPTPKRDTEKPPKMFVARSFDINKPGSEIEKLVGGILGGSVVQGILEVGQEVEIVPGIRIDGQYRKIKTKIVSLEKAGKKLKQAGPGGLLGVMTDLDPYLTKADSLAGNILSLPGRYPKERYEVMLETKLLERVVGTKEMEGMQDIKQNEVLMLNVGSCRSVGTVSMVKGNKIKLQLKIPVYADKGERAVISRQILGRWRLIGYGNIAD
ncbi:MAG: translation initiation factor IF-2 subunit gamma [Candidatus Aenigmarchaeota archaeon]|nr:translation initiation factor IF-2 subunit gamma [Candidatus Aenigmarchaeota archaeon]